MYSNMASRQWFIGVKSNTDKQKNRLRHPYTCLLYTSPSPRDS